VRLLEAGLHRGLFRQPTLNGQPGGAGQREIGGRHIGEHFELSDEVVRRREDDGVGIRMGAVHPEDEIERLRCRAPSRRGPEFRRPAQGVPAAWGKSGRGGMGRSGPLEETV
jgi:hypothetical protein